MKEERISSREMTTPEQDPGNQREARSRLAHQPSTGLEGHSRDVLFIPSLTFGRLQRQADE